MISNYTELLQAVRDWADVSNSPVFERQLSSFPALVEAKVRKRLRIGAQEVTATISTTEDKHSYTPPPRWLSARTIQYRGAPDDAGNVGNYYTLQYREPGLMADLRHSGSYSGPCFYTLAGHQIELLGGPATGGSLKIVYIQGLEALSDDVATNWLLADYPDVYLSGCMAEALKLMKGDDVQSALQTWQAEFSTELAALVDADKRDRWSGPPKTRSIKGIG